jgi:hypothetical protein
MITLLILTGGLFGAVLIGFLYHIVKFKLRKIEFKDWIVGDKLILNTDSAAYHQIQKLNQDLGKVVGWNENNIYLEIGDIVHKCEWSCFEANKSALWRRNYDECKKSMGINPGFSGKIGGESINSLSDGDKIDGKSIILLTEIECQVYLEKAINAEDYNTAEKIKKQMEKYR